jgi:chemotaxis protein methyltransferase CheR
MNVIAIKPDELLLWSRYIKDLTGINLDSSKGYLLETRLGGLLREAGAGSFADFYNKSKTDFSNTLRRKIIDAITTNETSFFRDTSPFDLLQFKLIPELIDRRTKAGVKPLPIRIWSAASSTGQEAYSTGIVLKELLGGMNGYDVRILGTDISDRAVAAASYGHFSKLELDRGLAPDKVAKYFTPSGDKWKIRDEVRAMATFKTMNLLEPFSFPVPFDIIFCRNVAIYFTEADKTRLFRGLGKFLAKDGALIIGSTESLAGLCPEFEPKRYLRSVFYQLKDRP